jgi:glycosyltransferase involved in cell wall biosynthesis
MQKPRVAFVVQRYGTDVSGGAETLCREIVEHLAPVWDVEVLTSCSREYLYRFENDQPAGLASVNSIPVRRFAVDHLRSEPSTFAALDEKVLARRSTPAEEERWLGEVGPQCSALRDYLVERADGFDVVVFFTYLYWTTTCVLPQVRDRAVLVPTAHDEPPFHARPFDRLFELPRALLCSTPEEEALLRRRTAGKMAPSHVVGAGVDSHPTGDGSVLRAETGIAGGYALYVGRIQKEKGCDLLFEYYLSLPVETRERFPLVMIGKAAMPIPRSPHIRHLGFVSEEMKHDALAGATILLMPSRFESLSLALLEAWQAGTPVLVNGECDVLKNQCRRSDGGLWYDGPEEFREAFSYLTDPVNDGVRQALAENGRRYVQQNHRWDRIVDKYLRIADELRTARPRAEGSAAAHGP